MTERLVAIADRTIMGEIRRDRRGRLTFLYDDRWRSLDAAYPLSLSMPLVVAEHEHARIEPWLWGLLPDNEFILARWGRRRIAGSSGWILSPDETCASHDARE